MFTLNLETENDAFAKNGRAEVARILRNVANLMEKDTDLHDHGKLADVNGNIVGSYLLDLIPEEYPSH